MDLIILAAGKSSRIYDDIGYNKCLIKLDTDETIIERIINYAITLNINNIKIVVGYKKENIINNLKRYKKLKFIFNDKYGSSNMVHSLVCALQKTNNDTIVTYSDVIFDKSIFQKIIKKNKQNITLPIMENWQRIWKIRKTNIKKDAENLHINSSKIITIGQTISNVQDVKYQFMGIIYIPKNCIKNIIREYLLLNDQNVQTTHFLDHLIKKKYIINYIKYNKYWYEFDDIKDLKNFKNYQTKNI